MEGAEVRIVWSRSARKEGRKAPFETVAALVEALARFAENPKASVDVRRLKGTPDGYRIRAGDWRLVFTVDADRITVVKIAPRGSAYE